VQQNSLLTAAVVLSVIGLMHSFLGERMVVSRIVTLPNLPTLRGSREYMATLVRWAWHLTSIAWWGTSAHLILIWSGRDLSVAGLALTITFALHGMIALVGSRGRHPAWPLFLIVATAIL
jgi:hypothetical protein